jgi:phosphopantetheinyl transferase (holo-ACP synthase)
MVYHVHDYNPSTGEAESKGCDFKAMDRIKRTLNTTEEKINDKCFQMKQRKQEFKTTKKKKTPNY